MSQKNLGGGWVSMSRAGEEEQGEPCTAASPEVTRVKEPQDLTELCGE